MGKKKAEPETAKPGVTKLPKPEKKKATAEDVYAEMKRLAANGVVECTSTLLRDKLNLDKEGGRDIVRRLMKKLETDGKVIIGQKTGGKRKRYVYRLKEEV